MKSRAVFLIAIAFVQLYGVLPAAGEPALRWRNEAGDWVYGSKPPPNAKNVERITGKTFSKYSSDKVISSYSGYTNAAAAAAAAAAVPEKKFVETPVTKTAAKLESMTIILDADKQAVVSACKVGVKNIGDEDANNVRVSFSFPDGTLVQAVGPETILPKQTADFSIPREQLPLHLKRSLDLPDLKDHRSALMPKVVMDFAKSDVPVPLTEMDIIDESPVPPAEP